MSDKYRDRARKTCKCKACESILDIDAAGKPVFGFCAVARRIAAELSKVHTEGWQDCRAHDAFSDAAG